MIKKTGHIVFLMLLIFATSLVARNPKTGNVTGNEKIYLHTDRSMYIVGEKVRFSACIMEEKSKDTVTSLILYAEILSPDGRSIVGSKFPIHEYKAEGCLTIPLDIVSGNYYLRAYTKYMRNHGPASYSYDAIKIINPLKGDVLAGMDTSSTRQENVHKDSVQHFIISTDKKTYASRQQVDVDIKSLLDSCELKELIVSVVPEHSVSLKNKHVSLVNPGFSSGRYYQENRGVSLTGKLIDYNSEKPVVGGMVNLSILGDGRDFMAMQTDSAGRFSFSLPAYVGFRDLFLCSDNSKIQNPKILVDNDFCAVPVNLPFIPLELSDKERDLAYSLAVNHQISQLFTTDSVQTPTENLITNKAFYGMPTDILVFDKYIQLPTLEEYFNELPTPVRVRKRDSGKYFKVIGTRPEIAFFDPLVMVDQVAVDNPEKILAISPSNISRIEVVNEPYVKGNITYGGIISIVSKRGDFAGLDLPASGIFINYLFQAKDCKFSAYGPSLLHVPDARNTLYWNADLSLKKDNSTSFSFKTADTPGAFSIVLKAIKNDGSEISQTLLFEVIAK
ncbi:MAG: hypothetical protein Q7J34_10155 [Bacteroidales bacterium]|nr:hypothetical protein [Bacteroidales bacterium]